MYAGFKFARSKYREHQAQKPSASRNPDGSAPTSAAYHGGLHTSQPGAAGGLGAGDVSSSQHKSAEKELTPEEKAEKKRMRNYRVKIVLGLFAPFTLQALNTTIVAAALPTIAAEFNAFVADLSMILLADAQTQQNWIISVFNLTSAAFLPFWAQAADIFGRHVVLQLAIVLMMLGSAICTGAPTASLAALLVGRALQGVGAAGVNICVRTVLADRVGLADYARNWAFFALLGAVGYTIGPVVGGYLTEASWRWCFAINLPVAAAAIVLVPLCLRHELLGPQPLPELDAGAAPAGARGGGRERGARRARLLVRLSTIDYAGQLLFLFGLGLLILALTWAGNGEAGTYRWGSPEVLAPLVVGAVLAVAWFAHEYSMGPPRLMSRVFSRQRPMMPWALIRNKDIAILFIVNFSYGMCMYAVMYFMGYYFQYVHGDSASDAGKSLMYFLPGLGAGAYCAMFMSNIFPRQTIYPLLLGSLCSAVSVQVLCWAIDAGRLAVIYGMMALAGFGVGVRMSPSTMHGLAFFPGSTAQITCVFAFALPLGGVVGLTIMSTVFNNKLDVGGSGGGGGGGNYKEAIMYAYYAIVPFMWLCVLAVLFLGNVWIRKNGHHEVVNGAYLLSLVTGKTLARETRHRGEGDLSGTQNPTGTEVVETPRHQRKEGETVEPV